MILVAAGFIFRDGRVLITQRPPGKHGALKWEFPGGKVEPDEDPRDALIREVREELDIEIAVDEISETIFHRYSERTVLLLFYQCRWVSGEPQTRGCHAFAWTDPVDLITYDFLEADLGLIRKMGKWAVS